MERQISDVQFWRSFWGELAVEDKNSSFRRGRCCCRLARRWSGAIWRRQQFGH